MVASGLLISTTTSSAAPPKLAKPAITCFGSSPTSIDIRVCAGANGAPAGFTVQWMLASDYALGPDGLPGTSDDNSWSSSSPSYCDASFSGVPGCSNYNLAAGQCITVNIGDNLFDECGASSSCANQPLDCDTQYAFRAFAHNVPGGLNRSDFTATLFCTTPSCGGGDQGCTLTQGYWKTHGPVGCNPSSGTNVWPVTSLMLGTVSYTEAELCSIFNKPAAGNGLISLAHQLIAAKLNLANGAADTDVAQCIADADALIGGLVIPPVGSGSLAPAATSALVTCLTNYNEGTTGPGHCQ